MKKIVLILVFAGLGLSWCSSAVEARSRHSRYRRYGRRNYRPSRYWHSSWNWVDSPWSRWGGLSPWDPWGGRWTPWNDYW